MVKPSFAPRKVGGPDATDGWPYLVRTSRLTEAKTKDRGRAEGMRSWDRVYHSSIPIRERVVLPRGHIRGQEASVEGYETGESGHPSCFLPS